MSLAIALFTQILDDRKNHNGTTSKYNPGILNADSVIQRKAKR